MAVMALGMPSLAISRRKLAPSALWLVRKERGGQPQRHAERVDHLAASALEHFAPADVVVRAQAQPGAELLLVGPGTHVGADLENDLLGRQRTNAVNLGQIDAADPVQFGAQIEPRARRHRVA